MDISKLLTDPEKIATAFKHDGDCPLCDGEDTWQLKEYCGFCCGSGNVWQIDDQPPIDSDEEGFDDNHMTPVTETCEACSGKGFIDSSDESLLEIDECEDCEGFGVLFCDCPHCDGAGTLLVEQSCEFCQGASNVSYVDLVFEFADQAHVTSLIGQILAAAGHNSSVEAAAALPVVELIEKLKEEIHLYQIDNEDYELAELFGPFGEDSYEELLDSSIAKIRQAARRLAEEKQQIIGDEKRRLQREARNSTIDLSRRHHELLEEQDEMIKNSNPYEK